MLHGRRSLPKDNLPPLNIYTRNGVQYAKQNYDYLKYRMKLHQNSRCTNIAFITDIHNGGTTDYNIFSPSSAHKNDNTRNIKLARAVAVLKRLSQDHKIHACIFGGDYLKTPASGNYNTKADALLYFDAINKQARKLVQNMNVMICRGNHDGNSIYGNSTEDITVDFDEYSEIMQNGINGGTVNGRQYKDYGYFDDVKNKLRVIFLNTLDLPFGLLRNTDTTGEKPSTVSYYYNMQDFCYIMQEQLDFFVNALNIAESGWAVIVFSHIRPVASNFAKDGDANTMQNILCGIIKAYRTKGTYSNTYAPAFKKANGTIIANFNISINADFTNNGSDEFICCIMGHDHKDTRQGFNYDNKTRLITTLKTKCFYSLESLPGTGVNGAAFDLITVDRQNKRLYFERYGGGISRIFDYGTYSQYYTGIEQSAGLVSYVSKQLTITVLDSNNNPIQGATVQCVYNGEPSDTKTTNAQGEAVYSSSEVNFNTNSTNATSTPGMPYDKFTLNVTANGYDNYSEEKTNINSISETVHLTTSNS